MLYTIDRLPSDDLAKRRTTTDDIPKPYRVAAFHLQTGEPLWEIDDDVFGTWLSYSAKHDILVEAGRVARDTLKDEPRGVLALNAKTGKPYPDFGTGGRVDLKVGLGPLMTEFRWTGAPLVIRDVIVIGASMTDSPGRM